jgi:hypothetical protein
MIERRGFAVDGHERLSGLDEAKKLFDFGGPPTGVVRTVESGLIGGRATISGEVEREDIYGARDMVDGRRSTSAV